MTVPVGVVPEVAAVSQRSEHSTEGENAPIDASDDTREKKRGKQAWKPCYDAARKTQQSWRFVPEPQHFKEVQITTVEGVFKTKQQCLVCSGKGAPCNVDKNT